ncbi:hypothetical protein HNR06_001602 [Nocardiopsis arvandica]|uniref:Uncharacterized protein n=1 Tax=Nocardiopsis sinuspersici TaxID=501010 RepID=A0A7Y9XAE3_9ACTN|nr:hypothetical protein [Nocardiopsis sinuspersici]NYH52013.1 hypothetical protein [Nocardiopsis sinuspersici]
MQIIVVVLDSTSLRRLAQTLHWDMAQGLGTRVVAADDGETERVDSGARVIGGAGVDRVQGAGFVVDEALDCAARGAADMAKTASATCLRAV